MKKLFYIVLLLGSTYVFSQNKGITYQAVIYAPGGQNVPGVNVANIPMTNRTICLQFSLLDASSGIEYQEEVKTKTDEFGMVNITIGSGTQTGGYASSFATIVWTAAAEKSLKVSLDATGLCNQFDELSTEKLEAVPFANAAITAGNVSGVVAIANGGTGATTAAGARTNLGIGNVENTTDLNKPMSTATKTYIDSQLTSSTIVDADATTKGKLQLAGDLAGTAAAPTVPGLALKENAANKSTDIVADATSTTKYPSVKVIKDYVDALNAAAGVADGSITSAKIADATIVNADVATNAAIDFSKLNIQKSNILGLGIVKGDLGLANVDNTSDANKPVSAATQAALDLKANATDLTAEVNRATTAEAALTTNVTANATATAAETTRATAAETTLTTNLAAEVTRATAAEATLTTNVTANATAIAAETTRATAAEATLTTNVTANATAIAAETTRATAAETTLTTNLAAEVTRATAAEALKENLANKSTDITVDALSTDKYPSVKLIKDYVDSSVSSGAPDATTVLKGKIKLAGDLTGTADFPSIATDAVTSTKIKDGEIATADVANAAITYAKIQNVAADKVLGRVSANAGVVEEIATTGTGDVVRATSPTLVTPVLGVATATSVNGTTIPTSKTLVVTTDKLNVMAATTSAELSGVVSDETGTGAIVFSTSPTLVTPTLGEATATTVNKVTITAPTTSATLTIADGKTLTASDNATISGTNTGDQTITLTGDVTGTGTGSFATTIGDGKVTNAMLAGSIDLTTKVSGILPGANGGTGVDNSGKTIILGGNLTTSGAFATTLIATADSNVTLPTTGTMATLAGTETLANKTLTSPTMTTPVLGAATASSINKVTLTAPASSATLTIADGKTLTASNSITLAGTDGTTMTFPVADATIARTDAAQTFTGTQTFSSTIAGSISGNAATVTTNADLTGDVTSSGNTTTIGASKVVSSMIADGTIVATDIATDAIEEIKIKNSAVTTDKIATANVTEAKLASNSVTTAKITDLNVTTAKLANDAVETIKIKDANVTNAKLDKANIPLSGFGAATADVALGGKKLTGVADPTNLQDAATKSYVDALNAAAGVADGSITSAKIADATIVNADVSATAAIAYSKLNLANSIVAADLTASSVTNAKLDKANIPLSGFGAATADVALGSNKLTGVADPSTAQDAATKNYVDTATSAITTLADGKIYLGNASNVATEVTPTGDVTITNAGVTAIGSGKVVTGMLATDAVTTVKITDANVTTAKLADAAVETAKIKDAAVEAVKIKDANVTTAKLADAAITTVKITDANVTEAKLAADAVTSAKIKDGEIVNADVSTTAAIAYSKLNLASSIVAADLSASSVTNVKLDKANIPLSGFGAAAADVALGSNKLTGVADPTTAQDAATKNYVDTATSGITTLADGKIYLGNASNVATEVTPSGDVTITNAGVTAIGSSKVVTGMLATDAVTTVKITDANVTTAKLADAAVTTAKITDANVTTDKLAANAVTTTKITDANVTEAKLAADAVTSAKIKNGEIATLDIANAAITYAKIQNVAAGKVLGNFTGSAGVVEEIATTGTGDVVRATSPTLVTPDLGIPSAIDLTNATGLPLTTGVTGILPIANGGTGATTAAAALTNLVGNQSPNTVFAGLAAGVTTVVSSDGSALTGWSNTGNLPSVDNSIVSSSFKFGPSNNWDMERDLGVSLMGKSFQFDIYFTTGSNNAFLFGHNSSGANGRGIYLSQAGTSNGFISSTNSFLYTSKDGPDTNTFAANTWYTIKVNLATGTNASSYSINGVQKSTFTWTDSGNKWFGFVSDGGISYIDNISVTSVTTGAPTFRSLVAADIPTLNQNTTGNAATATTATTANTATNIAGGAIGSVPYQSAAGTTALLAGNTTATAKFLTSTGTGTAATAPTWTTISAVPYTGATGAVDLGAYDLKVNGLTVGRGGNGVAVTNANTTFGISALSSSSTSGSGANTAIGNNVLTSNTSGSKNTGLGYFALNANVTGTDNTAVGYYALTANNSSSSDNTAIGSNAMYSNTSGTENTAVGSKSLYKNTTGIQNSIFGRYAYFNGEGSYNTAVGYRALMSPNAAGNTGEFNVSMGYYTGYSLTTGSQNLFLGSNAGYNITTGGKNIMLGSYAGNYVGSGSTLNSTGLNSVLIGYDVRPLANADTNEIVLSGYNGTAGTVGLGSNTTTIGNSSTTKSQIYGALTTVPAAASSTLDGESSIIQAQASTGPAKSGGSVSLIAGSSLTSANGGNINLTAGAGASNMTGGNIILTPGSGGATGVAKVVGSDLFVYDNNFRVGRGNKSLSGNTALGSLTLNGANSGTGGNTAIGSSVLYTNTTGYANTGVGGSALYFNTTGYDNTAIGSNALYKNTGGIANTSIGTGALSANTTGNYNVAIGNSALSDYSSTSNNNVAIGYSALRYSSAGNNLAIGYQAGGSMGYNGTTNVTGGANNIFLGHQAGNNAGPTSPTVLNSTGYNSVMIGYDVRPAANGENNEIVIAGYNGTAGTVGKGSNTTSIGNSATTDTYIYGNLNVTGQIKLNNAVLSKSDTYAFATTDNANLLVYTGVTAGKTITLPVASTNTGREITIKNIGTVSVAIASNGGYLISDSTTTTATGLNIGIEPSNNWIKAISDGTNWIILRALF